MDRTSGARRPGWARLSIGALVAASLAARARRQCDLASATILITIGNGPKVAAADKCVAGEPKREHAPKNLLEWAGRCHAREPA